jgi:hypothetical protein
MRSSLLARLWLPLSFLSACSNTNASRYMHYVLILSSNSNNGSILYFMDLVSIIIHFQTMSRFCLVIFSWWLRSFSCSWVISWCSTLSRSFQFVSRFISCESFYLLYLSAVFLCMLSSDWLYILILCIVELCHCWKCCHFLAWTAVDSASMTLNLWWKNYCPFFDNWSTA